MIWVSVAALLLIAFLVWNLSRRMRADDIALINERRRATSRMVSRGEFVDGNRHLSVALALSQNEFFYENSDMQGSLDLRWIREIEYDTELATGVPVAGGKVLRLRSNSQTFEFVLENDIVPRWHMMLPARAAVEPVVEIPPMVAGEMPVQAT